MKQKVSDIFNTYKYIIYATEFVIATFITYEIYHYTPMIKLFYREKKVITQIQHVVDTVKSQYSVYTKYDRINNVYLGVVAKKSLQNDGLIFHYDGIISSYHGGNLLVFPSSKTSVSQQPDAFVVGYGSLWRERCIFLATYDWRKINGVSPIAVLASSVEQYAYTKILSDAHIGCSDTSLIGNYSLACANSSSSTFPMTLAEAQSACSCEGNNCFVAVKFY